MGAATAVGPDVGGRGRGRRPAGRRVRGLRQPGVTWRLRPAVHDEYDGRALSADGRHPRLHRGLGGDGGGEHATPGRHAVAGGHAGRVVHAHDQQRGRLVVGTSPDQLLFGYVNPLYDNRVEGLDADLLREVAIAIFGGNPPIRRQATPTSSSSR